VVDRFGLVILTRWESENLNCCNASK